MDGYALMREIRQLLDGQGGQIPAIALTAYTGEYDQRKAIASAVSRRCYAARVAGPLLGFKVTWLSLLIQLRL